MFHRRRTFFITRNVHRIFLNKVQNKNKKKKEKREDIISEKEAI